jgi:hypothetical protein
MWKTTEPVGPRNENIAKNRTGSGLDIFLEFAFPWKKKNVSLITTTLYTFS